MMIEFTEALRAPISNERLESYRPTPASDDLDMVSTYFWNVALCETLYTPLHALEISLRNAIHATLLIYYDNDPYWFLNTIRLTPWQASAIANIRADLPSTATSGQFIAATNFSFWTGFFSSTFSMTLWIPNQATLLRSVFPHVPKRYRDPKKIGLLYYDARQLRNRVFHYGPIWRDPRLLSKCEHIMNMIGWISPEMRAAVALCCRFPNAHRAGHEDVRQRMLGALGTDVFS